MARAADSDLCIFGQEAIDTVGRTTQGRVRQFMFFGVPEMDARLVAGLDFHAEVRQPVLQLPDHRVFGLPRSVRIEIEDVIIIYPVIDRALRQHVPHRLHQAACDDPRIWQRKPE